MTNNKKQSDSAKRVTVMFGYGLFVLIVLSVVVMTVLPLSSALLHPTARYFNIAVFLITFVLAGLLPALGSYVLGDRATHVKNKLLHHYNGVLFGIAAYWVAQVFSFIGTSFYTYFNEIPAPAPVFISGIVPVVLTIIIMALVAAGYARKKKNIEPVLLYRPYQIVLLAAFVALAISALSPQYFHATTFAVIMLLYVGVPLIITIISYACIARTQPTRLAGATAAIVAASMPYIASTAAGQLISVISYNMIVPIIFGITVWVWYLWAVTRSK